MKSLELNWIRKFDKSLSMPEVVYSSIDWAGGQYFHPEENEICIDGKYYNISRGLIEISVSNNVSSKEISSTIAHEWRHHWQYFNLPYEKNKFKWPQTYDDQKYNKLITNYFLLNPLEMDALQFQKKYSSIYEEWEEILHDYL